jgi:hypothetical protein
MRVDSGIVKSFNTVAVLFVFSFSKYLRYTSLGLYWSLSVTSMKRLMRVLGERVAAPALNVGLFIPMFQPCVPRCSLPDTNTCLEETPSLIVCTSFFGGIACWSCKQMENTTKLMVRWSGCVAGWPVVGVHVQRAGGRGAWPGGRWSGHAAALPSAKYLVCLGFLCFGFFERHDRVGVYLQIDDGPRLR